MPRSGSDVVSPVKLPGDVWQRNTPSLLRGDLPPLPPAPVCPSFLLGSSPHSTVNICGQDLTLFLVPQPFVQAFWIRWRLSMDHTALPAERIPAIGIFGSGLQRWEPNVHRESRMKAAAGPFVPALFLQKTVALG